MRGGGRGIANGDEHEIGDIAWVELGTLAELIARDNVRCNRTLSEASFSLIESICTSAQSCIQTELDADIVRAAQDSE